MIQNIALRTYIWFPMRNESLHSSTRVDWNALHEYGIIQDNLRWVSSKVS